MKALLRDLLSTFVLCNFMLQCSFASNSCNDFVDNILKQLKEDREFFQEPYELSDDAKSFAIYNIESGYIYGLNTLHRNGDVIQINKGTAHLMVYLGAGELNLKCSLKRKVFHIGKPIYVDANIPYASMSFEVVPKFDGSNPEIVDFKIDDVKGFDIKVSGLGPIRNILYNAFLRLVGQFFKGKVRNGVEDRLRNFLKNKVNDFKIPHECLSDA